MHVAMSWRNTGTGGYVRNPASGAEAILRS